MSIGACPGELAACLGCGCRWCRTVPKVLNRMGGEWKGGGHEDAAGALSQAAGLRVDAAVVAVIWSLLGVHVHVHGTATRRAAAACAIASVQHHSPHWLGLSARNRQTRLIAQC